MSWKHEPEKRTDWKWEFVPRGLWYVVEHNGMLRTGPFKSKEYAREWFKQELDIELSVEQSND